nr:unnamed protein product [Callosobruchus analis]
MNSFSRKMLIKCVRLRRLYTKLLFASSILIFMVVCFISFDLEDQIKYSKQNASTNLRITYEMQLKDYENRIIAHLGENGDPAYLDGTDAKEGEKALKKIALNSVLSDRIPLNRKLRDPRNKKCRLFTYNPKLQASVIVIFYNELLSVILRTVWSILLQTPKHLLKEIILVDDGSTEGSLHGLLSHYLTTRLSDQPVKLVRMPKRVGLIRARLEGARKAVGDVLIFLDAHCETTVGWAEPLLQRIEEDRTAVLVPLIDVIEADTFAYSTDGESSFQVGGFSWSGHFTWIDVQPSEVEAKKAVKPVRSPTMAGGLFAIDRKYFWEIGSYDEQMDGWGGENLEMSFRIWQCGGRLETIPCSRVGHVFRYLDNVYPEKFVPDENVLAYGQARTPFDMCLDDLQLPDDKAGPLGLYQCHPRLEISQFFSISSRGELRKENVCAEVFNDRDVQLTECHGHRREQYWVLYKNGTIYHPSSEKCLSNENVSMGHGLKVDRCRETVYQRWKFDHLNSTAVLV